jgi:hypothetical protein
MKVRFIHRPSPAMIVACLGLAIALGGTSYATVLNVPRNSVGTVNLKNGAVTTAKMRSSAVTTGKLRTGAVTSSKVRNGTLLLVDFKPGQIEGGAPGAPGTPGVSGLQRIDAVSGSSSTASRTVSVTCPTGKRVIGGGARVTGTGANRVSIVENFPDSDGVKWNARAAEVVGTAATWELQAYALCANVAS